MILTPSILSNFVASKLTLKVYVCMRFPSLSIVTHGVKDLRSEDVEVRELAGVVVRDVVDARVRGGAEEAAGDGRALHAEEERLAGVVDVHQRLGSEQALQQPEELERELFP